MYLGCSRYSGLGGQNGLQGGIHVNHRFRLVVQPRILISRAAASHRAFDNGQGKVGESVTSTPGATPKRGSPSPQLKGPHQSVGVHGEDEQKKKSKKGWKWVKMGENPKMPYPPCGTSIKTYARGNNDAPSTTKYGSPVQLDAQIVALRPRYAKGAPHGQIHDLWLLGLHLQSGPMQTTVLMPSQFFMYVHLPGLY